MNPGLEGNPHAVDVSCLTNSIEASIAATLALAYEQRTASLIALAAHMAQSGNHEQADLIVLSVRKRTGL